MIKITKKARHANILKTVVAKKVCAYNSGLIFCVIKIAITTIKVRPVIKENISQK
jgi:hypothetical protein